MSVTKSYGYTNGTTQVNAQLKMPVLNMGSDYAVTKQIMNKGNKVTTVYSNLTSPQGQPELLTVEAKNVPQIGLSFTPDLAALSKKGYVCDLKLESCILSEDDQGLSYMDPYFIRLIFGATKGTQGTGGINSGADWLKLLQRFFGMMLQGIFDESDNLLSVDELAQAFIDRLMRLCPDLRDAITVQA